MDEVNGRRHSRRTDGFFNAPTLARVSVTFVMEIQKLTSIRFSFPFEPSDEGIIDLCDEEQPFYFNPYSGELSLEFPKLRTHTRGGILAYVDSLFLIALYLPLTVTVRNPLYSDLPTDGAIAFKNQKVRLL